MRFRQLDGARAESHPIASTHAAVWVYVLCRFEGAPPPPRRFFLQLFLRSMRDRKIKGMTNEGRPFPKRSHLSRYASSSYGFSPKCLCRGSFGRGLECPATSAASCQAGNQLFVLA